MSTRVEIVDAARIAEPASRILQASWTAPCLYYSADYLAWQFSFPGRAPNKAALGFVDGEPAGCAAFTARRFIQDRTPFFAYVFSFVAVAPSARGRGLAAQIYEVLLNAIDTDVPVVAFAAPGSVGERLLLDRFARVGRQHHPLQPCQSMGYMASTHRQLPRAHVTAARTDDYDEFMSVGCQTEDGGTFCNNPTREQWDHYRSDPRRRVMLIMRNDRHEPIGTAMAVTADVCGPQGVQHVPMLENVVLSNGSSDALAAAFDFAAEHCDVSPVVIAPNLSCVDPTVLRAARVRSTGSTFNAHLFMHGVAGPPANAKRTNVEVI